MSYNILYYNIELGDNYENKRNNRKEKNIII